MKKKSLKKIISIVLLAGISGACFAPLCPATWSGIGSCSNDNNCGWTCGLVGIGADQFECVSNSIDCCTCHYRYDDYECGWWHTPCTRKVASQYFVSNSSCDTNGKCTGFTYPELPLPPGGGTG